MQKKITGLYDSLLDIYKYIILMEKNIGKKMFDNAFMYYYIPCINMFNGDSAKAAKWMNTFYSNAPQEYLQITGFANDMVNTENKIGIIKKSIEEFLR